MSSQHPKKKKLCLLPSLIELHSQRCGDQATIATIKEAVDRIKDIGNVTSVERLRGLFPDSILVWLITKYDSTIIFSLMKIYVKSLFTCSVLFKGTAIGVS